MQPQPPIQSRSWARQVIHQSVSQMGDVYRMHIHWQSRLAVRHNVTYRHPFLDRRLCEFVLRLPPEHLWHAGLSKYILRQAMANKLP
ncbi:MAG: hypothetical protein GWN00_11260, partial [Aliifodinibius sp.]|nr:hypothetical protein [Fodinibius sp.]NIV11739.1 hypothetical protein [Fodinibius sp.]NIY25361.1 hypothetical protein [Fodinibius sp.]